MPSSARVHRTVTHTVLRVSKHSMPSSSRVHRTVTLFSMCDRTPLPFCSSVAVSSLICIVVFSHISSCESFCTDHSDCRHQRLAVPHFLIMDSFVAAVDEAPTTPRSKRRWFSALVDAGFTNPEHLVGTADSVIGELAGWLAGPAGGLLKRTFRCAEDLSEAKRTRKTMASSSQSNHLVSQVPSTLAAGSLLSLLARGISRGSGERPDGGKHSG